MRQHKQRKKRRTEIVPREKRRMRRYAMPADQRRFEIDVAIGRHLLQRLAKKHLLGMAEMLPEEVIAKAPSKAKIMKRYRIGKETFDARAEVVGHHLRAHLEQKIIDALLEMGRDMRERLEREGKLGRKRET